MRIRTKWVVGICSAVLAATSPGLAPAQPSSEIADAIGVALESIVRNTDPNTPTLIVRRKNTPDYGPIFINGRQAEVLSWDEARARQVAWFIFLSPVRPIANGLEVVYSTPASAMVGSMEMRLEGPTWQIIDRHEEHSSSGARYSYGELYYMIECRDGSEMAKRQEIYDEMFRLASGNTMTLRQILERKIDPKNYPGICRGRYFPEVNTYLDLRDR